MTTRIKLLIDSVHSQTELQSRIELSDGNGKNVTAQQIINLIKGLENGDEAASMDVTLGAGDGVASTGTVTIASSGAQSVTINGKTLTGGTDYVVASLSAADVAANIVKAISASGDSRLRAIKATSALGVVTIKAQDPGLVGNMYTTTATGAASAGQATLGSGAEATVHKYKFNV